MAKKKIALSTGVITERGTKRVCTGIELSSGSGQVMVGAGLDDGSRFSTDFVDAYMIFFNTLILT